MPHPTAAWLPRLDTAKHPIPKATSVTVVSFKGSV